MSSDESISLETFFRSFGKAITNGTAAVFAGAGLSRGAGYVDWPGLLNEFADELGLDLKIETDLVSVAQYHVNASGGTRSRLDQKIVDEFGSLRDPTPSHLTLSSLPIDLYWTTNYDDLIERSLREVGKNVDVKAASSSMTVTGSDVDATVHKLHGDLSDPGNIVITRDDYEEYLDHHRFFRERLQSDLISRTFLFLGFSFTDPHLGFVLSELRRMHRTSPRTHFAIMRRESEGDYGDDSTKFEYAANRQQILIGDLKRYGIQTVLVDEYAAIPTVLERLRSRYLRRQVFVSGAIEDSAPRGDEWLEELATGLGKRLIAEDFNLVSGFGKGLGSPLLFGALEELYGADEARIERRLLLRPFPQIAGEGNLEEIYSRYRNDMVSMVGFAVFIGGNRTSEEGNEVSTGVLEEFDLAVGSGVYPIPIGSTGWAAHQIWETVSMNLQDYFPTVQPPEAAWATLNDPSASPASVIEAIVQIMEALRPS